MPATFEKAPKGFTLIEFMIAVSIMALGLLALAHLLNAGIQSISLGGNTGHAVALAQEKIEELRSLPVADPARAHGGSVTSSLPSYHDSVSHFTRRWKLEAGPAGSQRCTVRVLGTLGNGRTHKPVEMGTLFR